MVEFAAFVLMLTALSVVLQERVGIPTPVSVISLILAVKIAGFSFIDLNSVEFDMLLLLLLPLLLSADVLSLTLDDLKKNWFSLLYAAGVSVVLTIVCGVLLSKFVLPDYEFTIPVLVMLFCTVSATDPIAVCSVFSSFKLPHQLKVIAEGESLFNDAIVLVIFGIALSMYKGDVGSGELVSHSIMVVIGAILIGLVVGFIGVKLINLSKDSIVQAAVMLAVSYLSFAIAEHFHWSGILAVIVSLVLMNHIILNIIDLDEKQILKFASPSSMVGKFTTIKRIIEDKADHEMIIRFIKFGSVIASTILFIALSQIVDIQNVMKYWKQGVAVFIAVTVIRAIMMVKFAAISNSFKSVVNINLRWWSVLSFAGVKGALSVLMVHMIPDAFQHKDMFEAIVVVNVMLSTFLYSAILIFIIAKNKKQFEEEYLAEATH